MNRIPKLKQGGLLGFDDFSRFFPGVVRAVTEFSLCHNITLLPMYGSNGNIYLIKPVHSNIMYELVIEKNITLDMGHYGGSFPLLCDIYMK